MAPLQGDDWGATCFWFVIRDEWGQRENTSLAERVMAESMGQASRKNNRLLLFPPSPLPSPPILPCSRPLVWFFLPVSQYSSFTVSDVSSRPRRRSFAARRNNGRIFSTGNFLIVEQPFRANSRDFYATDCPSALCAISCASFYKYEREKSDQDWFFFSLFYFFFFLILHVGGSILMVVESEGYLIASEIFANYALTDLGVFDIYFYNRVKILIIFLQKWWNIDWLIIVACYRFDGEKMKVLSGDESMNK